MNKPLQQLINQQGQAELGVFAQPVVQINYQDFDLRTPMDRRLGALAKYLKFNQFQFIGLTNSRFLLGIAIVDLKWVGHAFVYCYDLTSHELSEFSFKQLFSVKTRIDLQPNAGEALFVSGKNSIKITASTKPGQRVVEVHLPALTLSALIAEQQPYQPLALCTRAGYQGWVYTQKTAARLCSGSLIWQQQHYDLQALATLASVDWTAGFMRRETSWNWASLSCFLADGRRLGLNLAAGVNETGFTENALWLEDKLVKLGSSHFQFTRQDATAPWVITTEDSQVNLRFVPANYRSEKVNLGFLASNFKQHMGRFYGEIRLGDELLSLDGVWGLTEDHYAKW